MTYQSQRSPMTGISVGECVCVVQGGGGGGGGERKELHKPDN